MPPKPASLPRRAPDVSPDSLPRVEDNLSIDGRPLTDGGAADHPIHDEDQEDLEPQDYEEEIDEVERESWAEHPDGSAPPLDRLTQERAPDSERD